MMVRHSMVGWVGFTPSPFHSVYPLDLSNLFVATSIPFPSKTSERMLPFLNPCCPSPFLSGRDHPVIICTKDNIWITTDILYFTVCTFVKNIQTKYNTLQLKTSKQNLEEAFLPKFQPSLQHQKKSVLIIYSVFQRMAGRKGQKGAGSSQRRYF